MHDKPTQNQLLNTPPDARGEGKQVSAVWLFVWDFLKIFVIALAIIIPIRFYLFQPFIVTGQSMLPTFHDGEYLIIDEISYRITDPKRGEVAVIRSPQDASQFFIKRIIGLSGETVEISGGKVVITNEEFPRGFALSENYLPASLSTFGNLRISLNDDQYFVLGDNRIASSDSRVFGPITRDSLVGRVFVRAFPLNRFNFFQAPAY
jgi:signal peptidase I